MKGECLFPLTAIVDKHEKIYFDSIDNGETAQPT